MAEELEVAGVLARVSVAEAEPVRALADAVAATGAGLLVLVTCGGGGFHLLHIGSVALRTLQQSPAPVVLVPPARGPG
jgi:nucleotide-binding universal stress UspA family protein